MAIETRRSTRGTSPWARILLLLAWAGLAAVAVGCAADAGDDGDDADVADEALSADASLLDNCADPGVLFDAGTYYVACTGGGFPIYASTSATGGFRKVGMVFPKGGPSWSDGDHWAPEIHKVQGGYAAFYSARSKTTGKNAIGVAYAKSPTGPFEDRGSPLVQRDGSLIDVTTFKDPSDGRHYLLWKVEAFRNANGHRAQADYLRGQEISADGKHMLGEPRTIMTSSEPWEAGVVEAPWLIKRGSYYYLFYSGAYYCNESYGIGVARSTSPLGPFTEHKRPEPGVNDGRIVRSGDTWGGPGHNAVVQDENGTWRTFFHAYRLKDGVPRCDPNAAHDNNQRRLLSAKVVFRGGWPRVAVKL